MMKKACFVVCVALISGCGLFDGDEPFDINFTEEVPISFTIDASSFCPGSLDCDAAAGPSPDRVELPELELDIDLDILEVTGSNQLRDVSSRLKSVEVDRVEYKYSNNDLNIKTPQIKIYVGRLSASTRNGAAEIATIPQAEPGANSSGNASVSEEQKKAGSDILKSLQVSFIPFMQPEAIERGQPSPPKGSADVDLILHLKFVANPTSLL